MVWVVRHLVRGPVSRLSDVGRRRRREAGWSGGVGGAERRATAVGGPRARGAVMGSPGNGESKRGAAAGVARGERGGEGCGRGEGVAHPAKLAVQNRARHLHPHAWSGARSGVLGRGNALF